MNNDRHHPILIIQELIPMSINKQNKENDRLTT